MSGSRLSGGLRRSGFSLFEIVLVVAILAILAAMATPRYAKAVARYRLEMAARRVAADLDRARDRAATTSARQTVTFLPGANRYELPGVPDLRVAAADYAVDLSARPYGADLVAADFGGDAIVEFDGYGVPDSGGQAVLRVGADQKIVVLDPVTGRARVQ